MELIAEMHVHALSIRFITAHEKNESKSIAWFETRADNIKREQFHKQGQQSTRTSQNQEPLNRELGKTREI